MEPAIAIDETGFAALVGFFIGFKLDAANILFDQPMRGWLADEDEMRSLV
jgi:hypothetical protein